MFNLFNKKKTPKILDTSVLIDGRIVGIIESGFLDGNIIIPDYVLEEMQTMWADSKDHDKRQKGRKGLDIAEKVKNLTHAEIYISKKDPSPVDTRLVYLADEMEGKLMTLDVNLAKMARVHSVPVLNINDLYDAIKPRLVIGQEIFVKIKEKGKDRNQGRGDYEGTMVVVDDAIEHIGKRIKVEIRSVLGLTTGVLVFARPVLEEETDG